VNGLVWFAGMRASGKGGNGLLGLLNLKKPLNSKKLKPGSPGIFTVNPHIVLHK
jgi:hypothetical protein